MNEVREGRKDRSEGEGDGVRERREKEGRNRRDKKIWWENDTVC